MTHVIEETSVPVKVGVVANEFFDPALGRMGGFGWAAREAGLCLLEETGFASVFLTGELAGRGETRSHGIPLIFKDSSRSDYRRALRAHDVGLFLAVDYRPNYDFVFSALPDVPIILWVQDPRPPEDIRKINTLRIPGMEAARPQGIEPIDCTSLGKVLARSKASGRPILFASPAPGLLDKVPGTFGVSLPELALLPYILDFEPGPIVKSERPSVLFLGRLDPIKRPWVFAELARSFPGVDFLFLGQAHFRGAGAWEPAEVPENVRLLGHVGGQEKIRMLSSAWVLVNPSIHEALPVSFLEALFCQVPIVSCQNPEGLVSRFGVYTGCWDGTGLEGLPAFAAGLARLLDDRDLRMQLGQVGQQWARATHGRLRFLDTFRQLTASALELGRGRHAGSLDEAVDSLLEQTSWDVQLDQTVQEIAAIIPDRDTFILVDEDQLVGGGTIAGRRTLPFLERDGQYWGAPPNSETAVLELQRLRDAGARFIAFAWPAFWWLEHYAAFVQHLRQNYRCVLENERLVVFDLRQTGATRTSRMTLTSAPRSPSRQPRPPS